MKHLMKTLIGTSAMMLVFGSCSSIPGAQEWKIKKTATAYIEQGLKGGETIRWGSIRRKLRWEIKDKKCIYAEVKYTVTSDSGNTYKTLYLLLSKDCDSLYYASDENDTEQKLRNEVNEKSFFNIK